MDIQPFIERMLEVENLTDELEDREANQLLHWGVERLINLLEGIDRRQTAVERLNALMAVMRKINRIAGSYTRKDAADLVEDLQALRPLLVAAFEPVAPGLPGPADLEAVARQLQKVPPRQVIDFLTRWYFQPGSTPILPAFE